MSYFAIDILTPTSVLESGLAADSALVPTIKGEIDILPEHTHIVEKLDTGVLVVNTAQGKKHFFVTTGIVKVLGKKITVLANVCEKVEAIDHERAKKAHEKAQAKLKEVAQLQAEEVIKYQRKLQRAEIRMKMALYNKKIT